MKYLITEVAQSFGVSLRTLRFYEERGLLHPSRDRHNRIYSAKDIVRLELIMKGKRLGFSLSEIERLIDAAGDGKKNAIQISREQINTQLAHLLKKREEIDSALSELQRGLQLLEA